MNTATVAPRFSLRAHASAATAKTIPVRIRVPSPSIQRASLQPLRVASNRIWDPNLLDNLHVPLSRYAD